MHHKHSKTFGLSQMLSTNGRDLILIMTLIKRSPTDNLLNTFLNTLNLI